MRRFIQYGVLFAMAVSLTGCKPAPPKVDQIVSTEEKDGVKTVTYESGLKVIDLKIGTGRFTARMGDKLTMNYVGTFSNGVKFDSSADQGQPLEFKLIPTVPLIEGWKRGIPGMKVGGKRKLIIPYQLAYGEEGDKGVIPPKAELTFELELLKVNGDQ